MAAAVHEAAQEGTAAEIAGTEDKVAVPVRGGAIVNVACGVGTSDDEMTVVHVGIRDDVIRRATTAATVRTLWLRSSMPTFMQ